MLHPHSGDHTAQWADASSSQSQNTGSATRSRFQSKSREPSTLLPGRAVSNDPLPYDAPIGHEQAAQDSSAGEDLYSPIPALTGLRRPSPERRKTPQQQPQQQTATLQGELPSIPSSQSPGRRATQSGYDFVGAKVVEAGLTGLGVGGIGAKPATDLPRSRSTTTMATGRSASREAVSRRPNGPPKSPLTLFAGANHELSSAAGLSIDRRPSISSVQSGFFGAVPTTPVVPRPPSPNLPRLVRSSPSNSSPTMRSFPSRRLSTRSSFATTTVVDPHVVPKELPQVLILEHLDRTRPSVQKQILDLLRERHVTVERRQSRVSIAPQSPPAVDGASVRTRRTEMLLASAAAAESDDIDGSWILPNGFICVAIVCETDEEHDGAWGGVSRHLVSRFACFEVVPNLLPPGAQFDRFSLSHTIPAASFQAPFAFDAPSIHPLSSPSTAYLSPLPLANTHNDFVPPLQTYISDLISTLRHHPQLESRMLTARATAELALFTRTWVTLSRGSESMIVPSDVVAVLISVVGHRIALRAPRNEKSMFWGSNVEMLKRVKARNVESVVRDIVNKV